MRSPLILCTTALIAAMATPSAAQSLREQFPQIAAQYGTVMIAPDGARYVIYGPLNRLWQVDETGAVLGHAWIEVMQTPFEHVQLHWTDGTTDLFNLSAELGVRFTKKPIPLVAQYDQLLSSPLARPVGPLPAGARLNRGLHVFDQTGAQIGDWDSRGDQIVLRLGVAKDPIRLAVADLVAAMDTGKAIK